MRAPLLQQELSNSVPQQGVPCDLSLAGTFPRGLNQGLSSPRSIPFQTRGSIPEHLTADRGRTPPQPRSNLTQALAGLKRISDLNPLAFGQVPRRNGRLCFQGNRRLRRLAPVRVLHRSAVAPPHARAPVDVQYPACLGVANSLPHQPSIIAACLDHRQCTGALSPSSRTACHRHS